MTIAPLTWLISQKKHFAELARDERGATAIEYGLLAALISVAAIQALTGVGAAVSETFAEVDSALNDDDVAQAQPFEAPPSNLGAGA